jgi:hypothetical protein
MIKVILLAILYNFNTGEVLDVRALGFDSMEACQTKLATIPKVPEPAKIYVECVKPDTRKLSAIL